MMTETTSHQSLATSPASSGRGWRWLWRKRDLCLIASGYGVVAGLLGVAALVMPGAQHNRQVEGGLDASSQLTAWAPPDGRHWFGLNGEGGDMMGPVLCATGQSLWLAIAAAAGGVVAGQILAALFFLIWRKRGCRLMVRFSRWPMALPALFILLAMASGHGAGPVSAGLTLGVLCLCFSAGKTALWYQHWEPRGDIVAAQAIGFSRRRLLGDGWWREVFKRGISLAAGLVPGVLLADATLGFTAVGGGVSTGEGRIGALIGAGESLMFDAPWLIIFPGLVLWFVILILAALAWALRRALGQPAEERWF